VVPWGRTQTAAFGDRVNPTDYRRGPAFPDAARQKVPQWGGSLRTSLGPVGIEAVGLAVYTPSPGSLAASNQGGVRVARYQTALVRSPARVAGLLSDDDTSTLEAQNALAATASFGLRAWRRVGDVDISGSVFTGFDDTPTLKLRPEVARFLASEVLDVTHPGATITNPCADTLKLSCVGETGSLSHARVTSVSLDASWGLGIVIAKAELLLSPSTGPLTGKTALVVDDNGLRSIQLSQYALALALEGSVGEYVEGSLEVLDVMYDGVPAGSRLYGVELLSSTATATRAVHRVAAGGSLTGTLLGDRVRWRVRGEAGVLQPDVLMSAEARYKLPVLNLYAGVRGDAFAGMPGSPGWMRQDASLFGVFVGEEGG
jgi:hypothetical protein